MAKKSNTPAAMSGIDVYTNQYYEMAQNRIAECDPSSKHMLKGFYNYIIGKRSYTTAYVYLNHVIAFTENINDIRDIDIDTYNAFLATFKGKAASTRNSAYHAVQKYSAYLRAKGICKDDYMKYVERPKNVESQKTKDAREKKFLTQEEAKHLVERTMDRDGYKYNKSDIWKTRDQAIVRIFLNTGIRCSALYKLDVDDVDLEAGTISVLEKGSKYKKVPISQDTIDVVSKWLKFREIILAGAGARETALMISERRKRMSMESIRYIVKRLTDFVPEKNITPHGLRGTYGTNLYAVTGDVYFVQECMGHASPTTTELYIRGTKGNLAKKASDIMSDFLN